jgi:hypothetical protein
MKLYSKLLCATGVVLLMGSTSLCAEEQSPKEVMHKALHYIGSMDKFAFDAVVVENETADDGTVNKYRHDVSVKVDRPGKFRIDMKDETRDRSNYLNNGVFTMMDHGHGYYGQVKAFETIDATLDHIFEKYGIRSPLAQLIYSDMHKRAKFKTSKNFGTVMVDGTECTYVAFSNDLREVHVWIATGDKPLVKTYSIIDKTDEGEMRMNTSLYWKNSSNVSERDFIFAVPKGASKISVNSSY